MCRDDMPCEVKKKNQFGFFLGGVEKESLRYCMMYVKTLSIVTSIQAFNMGFCSSRVNCLHKFE